ncbi:MAG: ABC transporter permease [Candidatus Marinimicrobia bacterium]|jgi:lipoprotein-releasing system permease protein|nr:ABC transporter permease [Candidatus Neomarinimicrobiota bacterium]MCK9482880.1 ABC transporter permease [Candidatus Neomarinimicrobiota bacterium]MCK9558841.1 ABC transporter permease [Candidatus Neomarinimicrobiota bacterium]MDD5230566.1 ABC transporter permease [Candidatus Neomarinimicrobiota bacterium]MDD5540014.1 ABC transporter permease [Candidatus Neomarinimicrobiota bacterium]
MAVPFFIAKRHLLSHHKIGYISFISIIATIGLAVGVAVLILTISILNGFENEIKTKLLGFDSHIRLRLFYADVMDSTLAIRSELEKMPEVECFVPYIHGAAMIRNGSETDGIIVEGIAESDIRRTLVVDQFIRRGELRFDLPDNRDGIMLGMKLAKQLGVDIGDKVYLFVLQPVSGFSKRPRIVTFTVTGLYDSGIADYDDVFVYTSLSAAQKLFNLGDQFSGYQIRLKDSRQVDKVTDYINKTLGYPYNALSWNDLHSNLFEWLRIQRIPILLIFGLIAVVAVFNIVSSLMMIVIEKTRDIGILKSVGLNNRQVTRIFFYEGLSIGIVGTLAGFGLSLLLAFAQNRFNLISIPADVYFMNSIPVLLNGWNFCVIGAIAIACAVLATLYPSYKAVRLTPSEATRYE